MTLRLNQSFLKIFILLIVATCLNACSLFQVKPAKDVLRSRVEALMQAKVDGDWGKVYDFYDSAYKKKMSKDTFINRKRSSQIEKYTIQSIEMSPSGNQATVTVKNDISAMAFDFPGIVFTQHWVKEGWNWYLQVKSDSNKSLE